MCELGVPGRLLRPDYPHVVSSLDVPGSDGSDAARLHSGLANSPKRNPQNRFYHRQAGTLADRQGGR